MRTVLFRSLIDHSKPHHEAISAKDTNSAIDIASAYTIHDSRPTIYVSLLPGYICAT